MKGGDDGQDGMQILDQEGWRLWEKKDEDLGWDGVLG